jgi:hypothetical protein
MNSAFSLFLRLYFLATFVFTSHAALTVGEWIPVYKGVEHSISTNLPGSGTEINRLQVVHAVRVDLQDPDVEFFTTPRIEPNYIQGSQEVAAYTPTDFLDRNNLQVVINANFFDNGTYYLPAGTPMDLYGLSVSRGEVVSVTDHPRYSASITFDPTNFPTMIRSNWPPNVSTEGIYTAISGNYPVLINGANVAPRTDLDLDPRTVFGISQDRRYLYIVAIDGRQPGYSEGANYYECGQWLLALGASDGMNVDGGGSTTLVFESSTGEPIRINKSNAVADSGRERTVGGHFGIYTKPLPGFINDIEVTSENTSANIAFTTLNPTTSKIHYGLTTNLDLTTPQTTTETTNHSVAISDLTPETPYYFQISALSNGVELLSPLQLFTTTNYTTTNLVFDLTNSWKYFPTSLDAADWTNPTYDDSSWAAGPGLLWVDTRSSGPNPDIQQRATEMPINPASGFPFITYYFRTYLTLDSFKPGSSLLFQGYIDDGAVFYLNGAEIFRLRMRTNAITSTSLALGFPCDGDAECLDEFRVPITALPSLQPGQNVLAVEVHNYNSRSDDITFGLMLSRIEPIEKTNPTAAELTVTSTGDSITIEWEGAGGTLESAGEPSGPWTEIENYTGNSVTIEAAGEPRFFRLKR